MNDTKVKWGENLGMGVTVGGGWKNGEYDQSTSTHVWK
jgi:hypothetical protein